MEVVAVFDKAVFCTTMCDRGDYCLICLTKDEKLVILAMSIGHCRDIYEKSSVKPKKLLTFKLSACYYKSFVNLPDA